MKKSLSKSSRKGKLNLNEQNLVRRYLIWCYKTTKEEVDRIDRKFTQLLVDEYILDKLQKEITLPQLKAVYQGLVNDFETYMKKKEGEAKQSKFQDETLQTPHPNYVYLKNRLAAIEAAINFFLGAKELQAINTLYEEEMTCRILQSREH